MADDIIATGDETACRDCGEMVRAGLVRCWNCGAFMDPEVEARFLAQQADPPPIIYSDPSAAEADDSTFSLAGGESADDDSDGFSLNVAGRAGGGIDLPETPSNEPAADPVAEADVAPSSSPSPQPEPQDDVFAAALQDMREAQQKAGQRLHDGFVGGVRTAGGFIIFCPYGCKITVKEKHRGQVGKCPKCRAPFIVPVDPPEYVQSAAPEAAATTVGAGSSYGVYTHWIEAAHLHVVDPEKLKLKADSLVKDFKPYELVIAPDHAALVPLVAPKGSLFGGGGPSVDDLRASAKAAAAKGPFGAKFEEGEVIRLDADSLRSLKIVQPTKSRGDSMFAGVPVFGTGRIGVQLPDLPGRDKPDVISLALSDFRKLSQALSDHLGIGGFGADVDIPLTDEAFDHTCHYTDAKIRALGKLDFYKADPAVELILAGHQCSGCGVVISDAARKKEGIGGKNGKGIAKAKCPKCGEKMGDLPLFTRPELVEDVSMQSET